MEKHYKTIEITTVKGLAEFITNYLNLDNLYDHKLPNIDFGVVDAEENEIPTKQLYQSVQGWYGIKPIDHKLFDTRDLLLLCDQYGGCCAQMCALTEESTKAYTEKAIVNALVQTLDYGGDFASEKAVILVEMTY